MEKYGMRGGYVLGSSSEIYPIIRCAKGILNGPATDPDKHTFEIDVKKGTQRQVNPLALI